MSVLDQHIQETPQEPYRFESGDLDFISEMEQPKQAMNIDERPDFEPTNPEEHEEYIENDGEHDDLIAAATEETATLITDVIDNGAAFGLSLISKNPIEEHKATADQKSRIRKIIYVYCEKTGGYIPLWLQLIILIIGVYGVQIPAAMEARKINVLQEKIRQQEEQIHAYELEKQRRELADQLQARKAADQQEDA